MKYVLSLCAALPVLGVMACGSSVNLPPVSPEEVEVFYPGSQPMEEYKVLSRIMVRVPQEMGDQELVDRATRRAADLGADALIVSSLRTTTEGQAELDVNRQIEKILEGFAVYYPSEHPELEQE